MMMICRDSVEFKISETNFSDLPLIKTEMPIVGLQDTHLKRETEDPDERSIALFEDVLKNFPDTVLNIDVKGGRAALPVGVLLKKRESTVVWGSSSDEASQMCQNFNQDIPFFFSEKRLYVLLGLFYTGFLPFVNLPESFIELPIPVLSIQRGGPYTLWTEPPRFWWIVAWVMEKLMISQILFRHLKRRGIRVVTWTLDCQEDFQTAFDLGFEGIITDYPSALKTFLDGRQNISN